MKLNKQQVEDLHQAFARSDAEFLEIEYDGMGRLRVYQLEMIEKRHPVKLRPAKGQED